MLAKRIIPCLDVRSGRVVKGRQFTDIQDVDSPAALARRYSQQGADELVFYDITASAQNRKTSLEFVSHVAEQINIPFCVGGGVSTTEDIKYILRSGADKVSVNTAAILNPSLITAAARKFGSQCVVLSIDAKKNGKGSWTVYINGGRQDTGIDALGWAIKGAESGAGEIVVNSIDQDGMKGGYDLELLKQITTSVKVPVIASGGAGLKSHFLDAITMAGADGILAASVFHYKEIEIKPLKEYLHRKGVIVRMTD